MSESKKDPNATIQLDQVDDFEPVDLGPPSAGPGEAGARKAPPPLPPADPSAVSRPGAIDPRRAATARTKQPMGKIFVYGVAFVALLAVAIFAGETVGNRLRGKLGANGPAAPVPEPSAGIGGPLPQTPPSPSSGVMTIPTVEISR